MTREVGKARQPAVYLGLGRANTRGRELRVDAHVNAPGGSMRKSLMLIGIPVAAVGVAIAVTVGRHGSVQTSDKFATDLQQAQAAGLDLAQAQSAAKYALTEVAPEAKPELSKVVRQGNGAKSVR